MLLLPFLARNHWEVSKILRIEQNLREMHKPQIIVVDQLTATSGGGGGWKGGGGGVALTDNQRMQIQELEERDAMFDRQLDEIGEGIADLGEIAAMQGEEVKAQSEMLDNLK